jgi:hypothetical protein
VRRTLGGGGLLDDFEHHPTTANADGVAVRQLGLGEDLLAVELQSFGILAEGDHPGLSVFVHFEPAMLGFDIFSLNANITLVGIPSDGTLSIAQ